MSYILDALRKADHERSIGDVPDLDAPHWSRRRGGRMRQWVWVAIGLLIVNGALLVFLFNRDDGGEQVPQQAQARPDMRGYVPQPRSALQPERAAEPGQAKRLPLKPMARPERAVMARPRQPVPAVVKAPPASKPASVTRGNPAPVAVVTAPPVQSSTPEIPEWHDLSLEFRSGFNPPRLDVHVYDDEPSRRFILVDLQRFVEGDMLDSGAKLEKIQPGSIQLYYQGTRFRYAR